MVQWAVALAGGLQCSSLRGPGVCSAAPSKARALRRAAVRTGHASVGGSTPSSSATLAAPLTPLMIFPPSVRGPLPPTRTLAAAKARRNSALDDLQSYARGSSSKECGSHAPWCTRRSSRGRCGPCRPPPPARPARRHPAPRTAPAFSLRPSCCSSGPGTPRTAAPPAWRSAHALRHRACTPRLR